MAGSLTIGTLSDGTNSTSSTNCIQGSAKAWVNFNGTGTVAIRASYNVSSITDNGTGNYTVNYTSAMPDANYNLVATNSDYAQGSASIKVVSTTNASGPLTLYSTTQSQIAIVSASNSNVDTTLVSVSVFR